LLLLKAGKALNQDLSGNVNNNIDKIQVGFRPIIHDTSFCYINASCYTSAGWQPLVGSFNLPFAGNLLTCRIYEEAIFWYNVSHNINIYNFTNNSIVFRSNNSLAYADMVVYRDSVADLYNKSGHRFVISSLPNRQFGVGYDLSNFSWGYLSPYNLGINRYSSVANLSKGSILIDDNFQANVIYEDNITKRLFIFNSYLPYNLYNFIAADGCAG
jgi:hypothetical protein